MYNMFIFNLQLFTLCGNIFIVELNQDLSMAVRAAPKSEHFILQGRDTPHQNFIGSNKLFKDLICLISSIVRLVGVAPLGFFTSIILHIFVYIRSNIFMVIMMIAFVERPESILLSLSLSNTFEDGWSHVMLVVVLE